MKLYYSKGSCSLAVRIIINELKLSCEYESVDLLSKKTGSGKDYLTINTKGAVPALLTTDNQLLTENAVIQQYLAEKNNAFHLLPKIGDFNRYIVLQWLNFIATDIHKGLGVLFNSKIPAEIKNQIFLPSIRSKLEFLNQHLSKNAYLAGDQFSLPDAYLYTVLSWTPYLKVSLSDLPALESYVKTLSQRPSIEKSLQDEGLTASSATT